MEVAGGWTTPLLRALAAAMTTWLLATSCAASTQPEGIAFSDAGDGEPVASVPADARADSGVLASERDLIAQRGRATPIEDLVAADEPLGTDRADVAPAVFDQPNDGAIESALGIDHWTFDANARQLLSIDVIAIDHDCSQDLDLVLVDPLGQRVAIGWVGNSGCHAHGPFELGDAGTYVIEFAGGDGATIAANTGAYRFVPSFLTELDVAGPSFDVPNDGEIAEQFGLDRWSFEATEGDLLTIDVLSIDHDCNQDLDLVLEDPFGEREDLAWVGNNGCHAHGPYELARTGTYVIEFAGGDGTTIAANTGAYRFVPSFLTELDEAVAEPGTRLDGEIAQQFGLDRWSFEATEGDLLTIDVLSIDHDCNQDLDLVLEDPFGEREDLAWVGNNGCRAHGPYELARTGTYIIEFAGGDGTTIAANTGAYAFTFTLS